MVTMRIASALARYNESVPVEKRITKGTFAELVIPDNKNPDPEKQLARKRQMLSRWLNGKNTGALTPDIVVRICEVCKCDPNFLFNWK